MLQSMGSQSVGHNLATELNQSDYDFPTSPLGFSFSFNFLKNLTLKFYYYYYYCLLSAAVYSGQNFKNHLFMNLERIPSPPTPTHMTRGKDGKQWCPVLLHCDDTILKSVY